MRYNHPDEAPSQQGLVQVPYADGPSYRLLQRPISCLSWRLGPLPPRRIADGLHLVEVSEARLPTWMKMVELEQPLSARDRNGGPGRPGNGSHPTSKIYLSAAVSLYLNVK
jgi:hypothetical protein